MKAKVLKRFLVLIGGIIYIVFAAVFMMHNFLPMKERLLLFGLTLFLNLLLFAGILQHRKGTALVSSFLLCLLIAIEGLTSYVVWSSMDTLEKITTDGKERPFQLKKNGEMEPFYVFLSGKDTVGSLEKESRSDVNMILAVNPLTHRIHVLTIPRDAYMRIAGKGDDEYDKLTHAGLFDVQTSVETLENFFNIEIPYYAMVNFDSIVDIVDALGGIEVDNPEEFDREPYHFPVGRITLDGNQVLVFARERYHLKEGEMGRGQNHVRIIRAIIEKAISPAILGNYPKLMKTISEHMRTNMPKEEIVNLANYQIAHNEAWTVTSSQLQGFETMGLPSYQIPDMNLYMFLPSRDSMRDVKAQLESVLQGKDPASLDGKVYALHEEDYADLPIDDINDYLQDGVVREDDYEEEEPSYPEYEEYEPSYAEEEDEEYEEYEYTETPEFPYSDSIESEDTAETDWEDVETFSESDNEVTIDSYESDQVEEKQSNESQ